MKMKIQVLYLTGTALLIGAAYLLIRRVGIDVALVDVLGEHRPGRENDRRYRREDRGEDGRRRHCLLGLWPGARDRAGRKGAAAPVLPEAEALPEGGGREERQA